MVEEEEEVVVVVAVEVAVGAVEEPSRSHDAWLLLRPLSPPRLFSSLPSSSSQ